MTPPRRAPRSPRAGVALSTLSLDLPPLSIAWIREDDVPGVYDARDPGEEEKSDVDEQVDAASSANENGKRWEEDGDKA